MRESTRRAALRATAKVALSLTVVGCAAEVQLPREDNEDATVGTDEELTRAGGRTGSPTASGGSSGDELVCDAPPVGEVVLLDAELVQCCTSFIEPATPTDGPSWETWQSVADPDLDGCCQVLVAHVDQDTTGAGDLWEMMSACCMRLDYPMGPACTPWGPPVPPAMPRLEVA